MLNFKITNEISTGQILVALSLIGSVVTAYISMRSDIDLIKQAQAFQSADSARIRSEILQVREDVKDLGRELRSARAEKPMRGG